MSAKNDSFIEFETEDGDVVSFEVIEQTTIAGNNYLLVAETDEEEAEAYIMKETGAGADSEKASFEFVEDEQELDSISKIFKELLEDADLV